MRRPLTLTILLALGSCASMMGNGAAAPHYTVFFPERSSALEPAAVNVIAQAAAAANAAPGQTVTVLGWTDSIGSKPDDIVLSQQRAKRVADALIADGVAASRISRQGQGQTGTNPGVESRRVDITLSN